MRFDGIPDVPVSHATLDGDGKLIAADPALMALNDNAGGALGAVLAVPQLATVARHDAMHANATPSIAKCLSSHKSFLQRNFAISSNSLFSLIHFLHCLAAPFRSLQALFSPKLWHGWLGYFPSQF